MEVIYRRYLACVNSHTFEHLGAFVIPNVQVNGESCGLAAYQQGLADVVQAFPDYHWELQHLIIQANWLSARFTDTGTHRGLFLGAPASGKKIRVFELALYRFEQDKIAEVWVTADNISLLNQISSTSLV